MQGANKVPVVAMAFPGTTRSPALSCPTLHSRSFCFVFSGRAQGAIQQSLLSHLPQPVASCLLTDERQTAHGSESLGLELKCNPATRLHGRTAERTYHSVQEHECFEVDPGIKRVGHHRQTSA
jgi:hypothetical protein